MITATCPNSPDHKRFQTLAIVYEDWIVDEHGNFEAAAEPGGGQLHTGPNPDNTWTCCECGADATVTRPHG